MGSDELEDKVVVTRLQVAGFVDGSGAVVKVTFLPPGQPEGAPATTTPTLALTREQALDLVGLLCRHLGVPGPDMTTRSSGAGMH